MLLLDTCTLLWLARGRARLSPRAIGLLEAHSGALYVSAVSAFEIGIKHRRRLLALDMGPEEWYATALDFHDLREIPVSGRVAVRSAILPRLHDDPADRILVATAQVNGLVILTPDPLVRAYPDVETAW